MEEIWIPMLRKAQKEHLLESSKSEEFGTIILFGQTNKSITQVLDSLNINNNNNNNNVNNNNNIVYRGAVTYNYFDFPDEDNDSRVSVYSTTIDFVDGYKDLFKSLVAQQKNPLNKIMFVFAIDWQQLQYWARDIATWINVLRESLDVFDPDVLKKMITEIRLRFQSYGVPKEDQIDLKMPLENGQIDLPIPAYITIALTNSSYITQLEQTYDFSYEQIDFVQQFVRTIMLKHPAAIISTPSIESHKNNFLPYLLHLLQFNKYSTQLDNSPANVQDLNQLFIPIGYDSWNKISLLNKNFDPALFSYGWSNDLNMKIPSETNDIKHSASAINEYLKYISSFKNFSKNIITSNDKPKYDAVPVPWQDFLIKFQNELEKKNNEFDNKSNSFGNTFATSDGPANIKDESNDDDSKNNKNKNNSNNTKANTKNTNNNDIIGNVDFNFGGIKIKNKEKPVSNSESLRSLLQDPTKTPTKNNPSLITSATTPLSFSPSGVSPSPSNTSTDTPTQNEVLANFFQSLLTQRSRSSIDSSPIASSPRTPNNDNPTRGK